MQDFVYKSIFNKVNDAIFIHPLKKKGFSKFIAVNDVACTRYGYTKEEFLQMSAPDITKPIDALEHSTEEHRHLLLTKRALVFKTTHITKAGIEFPVEISANIEHIEGKAVILAIVRDISMNVQKEKEVYKNRKKFLRIFENSPDAIVLSDYQTGKFLEVNPGMCQISGFKAEELLENNDLNMEFWVNPQERLNYLEGLEKENSVRNQECSFKLKNGIKRIGLLSGEVIDIDGSKCILSIIRDITEYKKIELAVRTSEIKLRETLQTLNLSQDTAKIGSWWYSTVKKKLYWTEHIYEILGIDNSSSTPSWENITERVHPDDKSFFQRMIKKQQIKTDLPLSFTFRISKNKYQISWIEMTSIQLRNEKNKLVKIIGTFQDITEKKAMYNKLQQVIENQNATLAAIPDLMFEVKLDGTIVDYHIPVYRKVFLEPEEFLGKSVMDLLPIEAAEKIIFSIEQADKNGWHQGSTYSLDINNETYWYELSVAVKNKDAKEDHHFITLIRDITEQKRMEKGLQNQNMRYHKLNRELTKTLEYLKTLNKELKISKNKAEESDRLKSAFLANISHEVRTPMNGILGFVELMKRSGDLSTLHTRYLSIIEKSSLKLLKVLSDILEIAKIESGQVKVKKEEFDIEILLAEIYNKACQIYNLENVSFSYIVELKQELYLVNSDKEKISNIFDCLLNNAFKYTKCGRIEFGCKKDKDRLVFFVSDTGEGINEEHSNHIFELFRQGGMDQSNLNDGIGLGLSIAKSFVKMIKGNIWLESTEGKGSTFYFDIPLIHNVKSKITKKISKTIKSNSD